MLSENWIYSCKQNVGLWHYLHAHICLILTDRVRIQQRPYTEMYTTKTSIRRSSFLNHSQNIKRAFLYLPATVYNQYSSWDRNPAQPVTQALLKCPGCSCCRWPESSWCLLPWKSHKVSDSDIVTRTKHWGQSQRHSEKWKLKSCLWEDTDLSWSAAG